MMKKSQIRMPKPSPVEPIDDYLVSNGGENKKGPFQEIGL